MCRTAARRLVALSLAVVLGCGGPSPRGPAAGGDPAAREEAARAAWDAAFEKRLLGDELAAQDAFARVAAEYPETRHGAAAQNLGVSVVAVATVGALAAVAIPAFMKYLRRSKTTEATMSLRRLFDSSVTAYIEARSACEAKPQKARSECHASVRFPASAPLTPPTSACAGGVSRPRPADPALWSHPTWQALHFAPSEPTLYQYEYISEGSGSNARFTARAIGDLDCDGTFSTFERTGTIDETGNVTGGRGLMQEMELE